MVQFDNYKIEIDGKWSLEDLYKLPRAYEQVYFAVEAILPAENKEQDERIQRAFIAFPWRGGYSAVNFYDSLKFATPKERRPRVVSLKYASPGWIELFLDQSVAVQLAATITSVALAIGSCNRTYNAIYRDLQNRKLLKMEVESRKIALSREQIAFVKESTNELASILRIKSVNALEERTHDPLKSLKILMSVYRRIRILAEYVNKRKADFNKIKQMIP